MVVNKTWIIGLIGYVVFFAKRAFPNLEIPDEMVDNIADFVLLLMGLIPMVINMFKPKAKSHPVEGGTNIEKRADIYSSDK